MIQIDPEDRISEVAPRRRRSPLPLLLLGLIALAGAFWFFIRYAAPPAPPAPPAIPAAPTAQTAPVPDVPPAPDIPTPPPSADVTADPNSAPPAPLPPLTLAESDDALRAALGSAEAAQPLAGLLASDQLVARGVALVDAIGQGQLPRKLLPLPLLSGEFTVRQEGGVLYLDEAGYRRFDRYSAAVAALDPTLIATTFHRARPLLEEAYTALGHPADALDNAVIRALDRIIAPAPVRGPLAVVQVEGVYEFADPAVEALTSLQKLMLRMGPDNAEIVRNQATALRAALLGAG